MRGTYLYRPNHPDADENGFVEKQKLFEHICKPDVIMVISDTMPLTRHMADGKFYDSKSVYRGVTRAHNCVEIGNDTAPLLKPRKSIEPDRRQRRNDIARAIYECRNGEGVRIDKSSGKIIGGY